MVLLLQQLEGTPTERMRRVRLWRGDKKNLKSVVPGYILSFNSPTIQLFCIIGWPHSIAGIWDGVHPHVCLEPCSFQFNMVAWHSRQDCWCHMVGSGEPLQVPNNGGVSGRGLIRKLFAARGYIC